MKRTLRLMQWNSRLYTLKVIDKNKQAVDLSNYDAVSFVMVNDATWEVKVNSAGKFVDKEWWRITYDFLPADVDTAWSYTWYFVLFDWWVQRLSAPIDLLNIEIVSNLLT